MTAKKESRALILQAAYEAFAENGYDKTTMDDIVTRSGLSKGTLYWHFKNKHELFISTVNLLMQQMMKSLAPLAEMDLPASERIIRAFDQAGEFIQAEPRWMGMLVDMFLQSQKSDEMQQIMQDSYQAFTTMLIPIIQEGIDNGEFRDTDPELVSIVLMAASDGLTFYMLLEPEWDLQSAMHMLVELVLRGLQKE
jgi:AcrR family transcriptional regulator